MTSSFQVGALVAKDLSTLAPSGKKGFASLMELLGSRGASPLSFADWEAIDEAERAQGQSKEKPREKLTAVKALLEATRKK